MDKKITPTTHRRLTAPAIVVALLAGSVWFGSNWQLVPGQAASDNYLTRQQHLLELAEQIQQLEQLLLASG